MSFDPMWTDRAEASLRGVPVAGRDQIGALVAQICRDPGAGDVDLAKPDLLGRNRVMSVGLAVVAYQILDEDKIVRVVRVAWRS